MLWTPTNSNLVTQTAGSVVRTGASPDTVLLALADTLAHATDIVGTRIVDVPSTSTGTVQPLEPGVTVRMVAEPAIDDVIYLSDSVAGLGTNVAPATKVRLGICYDKQNISGTWFASLLPFSAAVVSNPLLLPDGTIAAPGLAWFTDPACGLYHTGTGAASVILAAINGVNPFTVDINGIVVLSDISGTKNQLLTISVPDQGAADADGVGINITADAGGSGGSGDHNGGIIILTPGAASGAGIPGAVIVAGDLAAMGDITAGGTLHAASLDLAPMGSISGINSIDFSGAGASINTDTPLGSILDLRAYDTMGAIFVQFIRLTSGNPPTCTAALTSLSVGTTLDVSQFNISLNAAQVVKSVQILFAASPYLITLSDYCLEVQSNGGAITATLPALTGGTVLNGRIIIIVDSGYNANANNITVARGNGADKINNIASSYTINLPGTALWLKANITNKNWEII